MLQEPQLSSYDLQFNLFGFHVRIAWGFWILAAVLGWEHSQWADKEFAIVGTSPGAGLLLALWAASLLLSLLVHELGHSLMHRYYGMDSRIVLYHFGGLAIPGSFTAWNGARRRYADRPSQQIAISAAGPGAQLLLAFVVWSIATAAHMELGLTRLIERFVALPIPEGQHTDSAVLYVLTDVLVNQSVFWALLNLLPILPLDGGNIMRELLRIFRVGDAWRAAAMVSMITAGGLAYYLFQNGQQGAGLMCLMFAASNFQLYQAGGFGRF